MCVKEVKWDIETADHSRRGMLLAIATALRLNALENSGIPRSVLDKPLDYSRTDLLRFYSAMEDIKNLNTLQIKQTQKNMERTGMELPNFSVEHAKLTGRGLEVWMCTVGAGIVTERRDDVREIWNMLVDSLANVETAIVELREFEQKTAMMTGIPSEGMFQDIDTDEWVEECRFFPSQFSKSLNFDELVSDELNPEPDATDNSIQNIGDNIKTIIDAVISEIEGKTYEEFTTFVRERLNIAEVHGVEGIDKEVTWNLGDPPQFQFIVVLRDHLSGTGWDWHLTVVGYLPFQGFMATATGTSKYPITVSVKDGISYKASRKANNLGDYMKDMPGVLDIDGLLSDFGDSNR